MINGLDQNVKTPSYFLQRSIEMFRGAPHIGIFGKSLDPVPTGWTPYPGARGDWDSPNETNHYTLQFRLF